jgi:hypothetical protein
MTIGPLTYEEAANTECEHGIPKVIVCPKCEPEKYVLSPKMIAWVQQQIPIWEKEINEHREKQGFPPISLSE